MLPPERAGGSSSPRWRVLSSPSVRSASPRPVLLACASRLQRLGPARFSRARGALFLRRASAGGVAEPPALPPPPHSSSAQWLPWPWRHRPPRPLQATCRCVPAHRFGALGCGLLCRPGRASLSLPVPHKHPRRGRVSVQGGKRDDWARAAARTWWDLRHTCGRDVSASPLPACLSLLSAHECLVLDGRRKRSR